MATRDGASPLSELGEGRSLLNIPCYRDAFMVGIAAGVAVGAHRFRGTRSLMSAADWGIKMLCVTSLGSFAICRKTYHEKRQQVRESLHLLNERQRAAMQASAKPPLEEDEGPK